MYLKKQFKNIMRDKPNENFVGDNNKKDGIVNIFYKRKYEKAVSECKKLRTFIKTVVGRIITDLSGE